MIAIVAVDENWGIGYQNRLLARIPEDQRFFREMTTGHVVVMGRKTLESFPGAKPLPGRTNVVLSRNPAYQVEGAVVVHSTEELFAQLAKYEIQEKYLIGGEHLYAEFLDRCEIALVTKIKSTYPADAYFPNLDVDPRWELIKQSPEKESQGVEISFCTYMNKHRGGA